MRPNDGNARMLLSAVASVLGRPPELAAAYVYGSAAAGRSTPLSDVDVALVAAADFPNERRGALLRNLTLELGRACPGAPFDLSFLDELPVAVAGRVVTEGALVVDKDPARRVAAEVHARMSYHDFLWFEREGTRAGLRGLRQAVRHG